MRYIALFLLAVSLIKSIHAEVVSGCTPSQIHLSLGDSYYTSKELTDLVLPSSSLNYNQAYLVFHTSEICNFTLNITNGTNSSQVISYQNITLKNNFNYTFKTDTNTNVTYKSVAYTALIQNLTYGTLYTYNIQDSQNKSLSKPVNFTLANPRISNTTHTSGNLTNKTISSKIVVIGNLDKNTRGSTTLSRVGNNMNNVAGVIQLGGIAYNLESNNGATGDSFFDAIQTLGSSTPLVMTSGSNVSFANYSFFDLRVRNPLFNQTHNRYFSYNLQGIHFVSIDFDYYENSTQDVQTKMLAWVKTDLETANNTAHRNIYPFIVVVSSQSIYCADNTTCAGLYTKRKAWDELFYDFKVNLVISATSSAYQRLGQIYQNTSSVSNSTNATKEVSNQKAPLYINEGIGGYGDSTPTQYNISGYAQALAFNPGYGELYLLNSTDDIRLIYNHYDSQNGSIVDSIQLIKPWNTKSNSILSSVGSIMKIIFGIVIICGAIQGFRIYKKRKEDPERVRLTNVKEMNPSRIYGGKHATNISMVDLVL